MGGRNKNKSQYPPARYLKFYREALPGFSHFTYDLKTTLLSQACVLENGSVYGNSRQNIYIKDRGRGDERSLIVRIELTGQPRIVSPQ